MTAEPRHICGLSGGKDSTALALHLRDTRPHIEVEYHFCDTGAELPEVYETIDKLEELLQKPITRLRAERDIWEQTIHLGGMIPTHRRRWCTKQLKIEPFLAYIGDDHCIQYVGIRSDERVRVNTHKYGNQINITLTYPFVEDNIDIDGVHAILAKHNVELPSFYEWKSRSGCYMCFYQRNIEWVGLAERHPDLYQRSIDYEQGIIHTNDGQTHDMRSHPDYSQFNLKKDETLVQLRNRKDVIKQKHKNALLRVANRKAQLQFEDATFLTDGVEESCPEVGWCDR